MIALSTRFATASNKKIAVAMRRSFIDSFDAERDAFVFGYRLVKIADLAHQRDKRDLAEPVQAAGYARFRQYAANR